MSLKQQTFSGIKWIFALNIAQKAISFGTTVILARILSPADFGLFALAFVLIDALGLFKSMGIDYALIRRKEDTGFDKAANTAFLLIPIFGVILFLILYIIAPWGAKFLGNDSLTGVVRILGLIFIIGCFGRIPDAILNRSMRFRERSIAEIIGGFTYSLCAVILAFLGFGVWSLVIGYVLQVLIQISSYWYFAKWRPKFEFDKKIALEMLHYGKYIIAGSLVGFIRSNLDNIIVGKLLGVAQLGFYAMAFSLANFSSEYLISKLTRVLFPAFSKVQHDREYFGEVFLRVEKYIAMVAVPFGIGLFLLGPVFLKVMYGDKWLPAIGILKVLSIAAIFKALNSAVGPAILAGGKSKLDFYLNVLQAFIFFIFLMPSVHYFGILGAGYAVILSAIITYTVSLLRIQRVLEYKFLKLLGYFRPVALSAAFMFIITVLLKMIFIRYAALNIFGLIIITAVSGSAYLLALFFSDRLTVKELKDVLFAQAGHKHNINNGSPSYFKVFAANSLYYSGISRLILKVMLKVKPAHFIFMYHRLNNNRNLFPGVNTKVFEKQIMMLKKYFEFVTVSELSGLINDSSKPRAVITFDDGYRNTFTNAFPILKKNNITATVFLATGAIDTGGLIWTDKLNLLNKENAHLAGDLKNMLKNMPNSDKEVKLDELLSNSKIDYSSIPHTEKMLSWDEVFAMAKEGCVEFGAHTVNHPILTRISPQEAEKEILDSKIRIESATGKPVTAFCYPNGRKEDYNETIEQMVEKRGFKCAVTTVEGKVKRGDNNFALKRISLGDRTPSLGILKIIKELAKNG